MMISVVVVSAQAAPQPGQTWTRHVTAAKGLWSLHTRRQLAASDNTQVAVTSVPFQSIRYSCTPAIRPDLDRWSSNPYPAPTASTDPPNRDRWLARAESISVHTSLPPHPPRRPRLVRCPSLTYTYPRAADKLSRTLQPSPHLFRLSDSPPLRVIPCG